MQNCRDVAEYGVLFYKILPINYNYLHELIVSSRRKREE
jgi:hypothetical protein